MVEVVSEDDDAGGEDTCDGARTEVWPRVVFRLERLKEGGCVAKSFFLSIYVVNSLKMGNTEMSAPVSLLKCLATLLPCIRRLRGSVRRLLVSWHFHQLVRVHFHDLG